MRTSPARVDKPILLIIESKSLNQTGIRRLLDNLAEAFGLTVTAIDPDVPLNTNCLSGDCEMIVVSIGSASIEDAKHQTLIESARKLSVQAPLVIISDREDPAQICAAFQKGAIGFIPTSLAPSVAFQALSFIRSGGSFFPLSVLSTIREVTSNSALTGKQEEVFDLLRQGDSNKAIARRLGMSEATVKVHVRRILHKFKVRNRTQLAVSAMNQSEVVPVV